MPLFATALLAAGTGHAQFQDPLPKKAHTVKEEADILTQTAHTFSAARTPAANKVIPGTLSLPGAGQGTAAVGETKKLLRWQLKRYLLAMGADPELVPVQFVDEMTQADLKQAELFGYDLNELKKTQGVWYEGMPGHRIVLDAEGMSLISGGGVADETFSWLTVGDAAQRWKLDEAGKLDLHSEKFLRAQSRAENVKQLARLGIDPKVLKETSEKYGKRVLQAVARIDPDGLYDPMAHLQDPVFQSKTAQSKGKKIAGELYDDVMGQEKIVSKHILQRQYERYLHARGLSPAQAPMVFVDELSAEEALLRKGAIYYDPDVEKIFLDVDALMAMRDGRVIDEQFGWMAVAEEIEHRKQHLEGGLLNRSHRSIEAQAYTRKMEGLAATGAVEPREFLDDIAKMPQEMDDLHPSKLEYLQQARKDIARLQQGDAFDPRKNPYAAGGVPVASKSKAAQSAPGEVYSLPWSKNKPAGLPDAYGKFVGFDEGAQRLDALLLPLDQDALNPNNLKSGIIKKQLKAAIDPEAYKKEVQAIADAYRADNMDYLRSLDLTDEQIANKKKWAIDEKALGKKIKKTGEKIADYNNQVADAQQGVRGWLKRNVFRPKPPDIAAEIDGIKKVVGEHNKDFLKFASKEYKNKWKKGEWAGSYLGGETTPLASEVDILAQAQDKNWKGRKALLSDLSEVGKSPEQIADGVSQQLDWERKAQWSRFGAGSTDLADPKAAVDAKKLFKAKKELAASIAKYREGIEGYLSPGKIKVGDSQLKVFNRKPPKANEVEKKLKELGKVLHGNDDHLAKLAEKNRKALAKGKAGPALEWQKGLDADLAVYGGGGKGASQFSLPGSAGKTAFAAVDVKPLGVLPEELSKYRALKNTLENTLGGSGKLGKSLGKLNLGPMDFLMTGVASPVMFKMGGGGERAGRLATMNALENFTVEPLAMAAVKKLLLRAGFSGAKLSLGGMLPLAPLVIAESFVEDSVEEYHRTVKLNKLGVKDVEGDALSVMGRTSEGWSDFAWNSSEERGIKGSDFYAKLAEGHFKDLEAKARQESGRELDEGELLLLFEEADKRANRKLPDAIGDEIHALGRMSDPAQMRAKVEQITAAFNADPEALKYAGSRMTTDEVFDMAMRAAKEDADYAASAPGMMFKGLTDAVYMNVRGFNQGMRPVGAGLDPAGKALQEGMIAAADALSPVGAALEPGVSAAQKEIEKGLVFAGEALEPIGKSLWDFGSEVGRHMSPVTDVLGKLAMNIGGLIYNGLGLGAKEQEIREEYEGRYQILLAAKNGASSPPAGQEPARYAAMGPSLWKSSPKPACGEGYIALWKGDASGWECGALPGKQASKTPITTLGGKPTPSAETRTLATETLGRISVEKKTPGACKPYYVLLETGVCIKDTGLFRRLDNPRVPFRGVAKCRPGEKVMPSDKPRKGAKLCASQS